MEIQKESYVSLKFVQLEFKITTISFSWQVIKFRNLGDGIYDKLSNEEVITIVWETLIRDEGKYKNVHEFCGKAV
jgi:hypothetical protein